MTRIRSLKPDFFRSPSLARVSVHARYTFAGLLCEADAAGRGKAHPAIVKGGVWPLDDDVTVESVAGFMDELAATNHLQLYEVDGDPYFEIVNWKKHQSASYRGKDERYPPPPAEGGVLHRLASSVRKHDVRHDDRGHGHDVRHDVGEGKVGEGRGGELAPSQARPDPLADLKDAIVSAFGWNPDEVPDSRWGEIQNAAKNLSGIRPRPDAEEIALRLKRFRKRMPSITHTPSGLVKFWPDLAPKDYE